MAVQRPPRHLLVLHLTVLVWGFTGILGALISVSATHLVWYRVVIAFLSLWMYFAFTRQSFQVSRKAFFQLFFTGALVGLHWILFFQSIKSSTVSVALVCISSLTLFTALLEPVLNRTRLSRLDIIIGLLIVAGICLIFKFETRYTLGIACGLACAVCASLFSIINSRQVKNRPAAVISFYEMGGALFWISGYLLASGGFDSGMKLHTADIFYLLILGVVCTSMAYVAGVSVMKEFSAFRVALITNLEPVYGILLAFLFFGKKEHMTAGFYAGASIVLGAVFLYPVLRNILEKRRQNRVLRQVRS